MALSSARASPPVAVTMNIGRSPWLYWSSSASVASGTAAATPVSGSASQSMSNSAMSPIRPLSRRSVMGVSKRPRRSPSSAPM
ncbi:hypothetical protein D320_19079 [Haloferax sp. BAB-2207]|nr:hypothetical protein D320_19079 [Haloferax sp. BAB-2207]